MGLYLLLRGRLFAAAVVGAAGLLVPGIYALYSPAQGWPALPMPVLLKGTLSSLLNLNSFEDVLRGAEQIVREKYLEQIHMPILIALTGFAYRRNRRGGAPGFSFEQTLPGMYLLIAIQHVHLAGPGWYFRYEAYPVAPGLVLLAMHIANKNGRGRRSEAAV